MRRNLQEFKLTIIAHQNFKCTSENLWKSSCTKIFISLMCHSYRIWGCQRRLIWKTISVWLILFFIVYFFISFKMDARVILYLKGPVSDLSWGKKNFIFKKCFTKTFLKNQLNVTWSVILYRPYNLLGWSPRHVCPAMPHLLYCRSYNNLFSFLKNFIHEYVGLKISNFSWCHKTVSAGLNKQNFFIKDLSSQDS